MDSKEALQELFDWIMDILPSGQFKMPKEWDTWLGEALDGKWEYKKRKRYDIFLPDDDENL